MDQKKLTAEQELLSVIEGQKNRQGNYGAKGQKVASAERKNPVLSPDLLKARLAFAQEGVKNFFKAQDTESAITITNNLLIVCIAVIFIYLAVEILFKPKKVRDVSDFLNGKKPASAKAIDLPSVKELSYYLGKLQQRDLFTPKPQEEEVVEEVSVEEARSSQMADLVQDLRLVGIAPASEQEETYAMIENTKTETTFFLKEGETLKGLTIEKILQNKIILTDGVQSVELQ